MRSITYDKWIYYVPSVIILLIFLAVALLFPKGNPELYINSLHHSFFDFFFYYITETGTGYFFAIIAVLLLFYRYSVALTLGAQGILATFISNLLKRVVFTESPRPPAFFSDHSGLHFIEGSPVFYSNSFPSGHSITIFVLCTTLVFFLPRKYAILIWLWAVMVLLSRVYLLRHFFLDVSVGGLIGFIISISTTGFLYNYLDKKLGTSALRFTKSCCSQ